MVKWERPSCNNCLSRDYKIFLENITSWEYGSLFTLVQCNKCGLVYLNPRPTRNYIGQFYLSKIYWNNKIDPQRAYGYLYNFIFNDKKDKRRILDIGAGNGLFLTEFRKAGWEIDGVELSKYAVRTAKKMFGISLKNGDFLNFAYKAGYFDVVVMNNVLEHLHKPKETLKKVSRVLNNDGILVLSCPNIKSFGFSIFRSKWYGVDAPRHLYQFSLESLENMLLNTGFKIESVGYNYWAHNYPVLFESFRLMFSPRFRSEGLTIKRQVVKKRYSAKVVLAKTISWMVAFFESIVGGSEVLVVVARKV